MSNSETFNKELNYIQNNNLRNFISNVLNDLPDYFRHIGASTSGKYHPAYTLGEGGLIRHTRAAVGIAKELIRAEIPFAEIKNETETDIVYASLILHDGLKCGMWEDKTAFNHPILMSNFIEEESIKYDYTEDVALDKIRKCIESHMGKWNTNSDYDFTLPKPVSGIEQLVHLCDYLASRKNLEFKFDVEGSVN